MTSLPRSFQTLGRRIARRAENCDSVDSDLEPDLEDLREEGWLIACLPSRLGGRGWGCEEVGTEAAFQALRMLGSSNLSVARLFEGHMNACKLIDLYASDDLRQQVATNVQNGVMIGVWGADDPADPLRIDQAHVTSEDAVELSGSKRFASGLKSVDQAVITVSIDDGDQLYLVPTDDPARADLTGWNMNGMRATRSGAYDFSGIVVRSDDALGSPGDYTREPHFEGGVWRYCAVHLGAMEAIYALTRNELIERNRSNHPSQQQRLVQIALEIECTRGLIQRAAEEVEAAKATPGKAVLSLLAREKTHTAGKKVIQLSEDALGMSAHATGSPGERLRRDLSLFLCQAAPDAKRSRIAEALIATRRLPDEL